MERIDIKSIPDLEESRIIKMPNGNEIGVTMKLRHWKILEWIDKDLHTTVETMVDAAIKCDEGKGFDFNLMECLDYFEQQYHDTKPESH